MSRAIKVRFIPSRSQPTASLPIRSRSRAERKLYAIFSTSYKETPASRTVKSRAKLSRVMKSSRAAIAVPSGLEPETVCLEGRCSIQLSYGTSCGRFRTAKFGRELGRMKSCRANSSEWGVQKGATPE